MTRIVGCHGAVVVVTHAYITDFGRLGVAVVNP